MGKPLPLKVVDDGEMYVSEAKIYPREMAGRFQRLRYWAVYVLLGLYYGGTGWGISLSALLVPAVLGVAPAPHGWTWAWWALALRPSPSSAAGVGGAGRDGGRASTGSSGAASTCCSVCGSTTPSARCSRIWA